MKVSKLSLALLLSGVMASSVYGGQQTLLEYAKKHPKEMVIRTGLTYVAWKGVRGAAKPVEEFAENKAGVFGKYAVWAGEAYVGKLAGERLWAPESRFEKALRKAQEAGNTKDSEIASLRSQLSDGRRTRD